MSIKKNEDVRQAIKNARLCNWQVAKAIGRDEPTFSRMLREELPDCKKLALFQIIENLTAGGSADESMQTFT